MSDQAEVVDEQVAEGQAAPTTEHSAGLADLFEVPLMSVLNSRRTRRIARGTSIKSGQISHESQNQPEPLTKLEEAVLIVASGTTGFVMHDGPLQTPAGGTELGTPFVKVAGRSAPSPDNAQAAVLFMLNDEGTWLLKRLSSREAVELYREMPPRWKDWSESDWIAAADLVKVKVYDKRLEFPREWPYYIGWNKQISNVPGSTVFTPLVDCTYQYINAFLILASEPDGQRSLFVDDFRTFHPKTLQDWVAWVASNLKLAPKIPYHPIGGIKRVRSGFVNPDNVVPLGLARTFRTDHDSFFLLQNLNLVGEALGVGGWIHASIFPPYIMQRRPEKGWYGYGFREQQPKNPYRWPPLPASQPNYVGIDGFLEGLCPPYVKSMDEAVDKVMEMKLGAAGCYGEKDIFAKPYKDSAHASEYLRLMEPHSPRAIDYAKEICNYIYDTYGRFPAHTNAFYNPGIWIQFSHLEMEYYEKFAQPWYYVRQAAHDGLWHGNGAGGP
ncbi:MAG TPA: hypothetical protein VHG90_11730 [Acidimicrobiales bacterium]|nr:hypothetical protein [Acidimicrobiales bacterium]